MYQKFFYLCAAVALNAHSFFTMPNWQPDTWDRLAKMAVRDFSGIEPFTFSVFVLFGMFSVLLAALILIDGWYQRIAAWPFALSMMVLGPSMVFIYQAFRQTSLSPVRPQSKLEEIARSTVLPMVLIAITLGALWDGRNGNVSTLWEMFQNDYLTHAMIVDEILFVLLTPILVRQDCHRIGRSTAWVWISLLLPIVGACIYLSTRKPEQQTAMAAA